MIGMPHRHSTAEVSEKFEYYFSEVKAKHPNSKIEYNMIRVILKIFGWDFILLLILGWGSDIIAVTNLFLTSFFLSWLKDDDSEKYPGYLYALLFSVLMVISSTIRNGYFFISYEVGLAIKKGIGGLLYKKVLRFSQKSRAKATSGKIIAIVSGELQLLERGLVLLPNMFIGPVTLTFWFVLIGFLFEEAIVFGVIIAVLVIIAQFIAARYLKSWRYNEGLYSDKRMNSITDAINGIRTVKAYAWEVPFRNLINKFRKKMMQFSLKIETVEALLWGFSTNAGYLIALPIFGYHYAMGRKLDYEDSLVTISILGFISHIVFQQMFLGVGTESTFRAVLKRVGEVLELEEYDFDDKVFNTQISEKDQVGISIENASFTWGFSIKKEDKSKLEIDEDYDINLQDITFSAGQGELIAVVGAVGCGKSTFLSTCMNELKKIEGSIKINGKVSYVKQEPFIMSGTLKDNILFGNEYDQQKFDKAVEVCWLEHDFSIFNRGADTEIGERGINASGGQKARISLARAVYEDADIYLLDDPLSAVDPDVAKKLYKLCIEEYLSDKLVILVTHQVQYIKNVKKILLFEDGKIKMQGTYDELKNNGMDFDEIIKQYQGDKEDKKDDIFGDDSKDPDENFEPAIENNYEDQDYEDHKLPPIDKKHIKKPDENNQADIINQTDSNILDKKDVNIIEKEAKDEGQVSIKTWYRTFKYGLGLFGMFIIIFLGLLAAFLNLVCNFVIGEWAKQDEDDQEDSIYYNLFWIIVVVFITASFLRAWFIYFNFLLSSNNLHKHMVWKILRAPSVFFDSNPIGRILTR